LQNTDMPKRIIEIGREKRRGLRRVKDLYSPRPTGLNEVEEAV